METETDLAADLFQQIVHDFELPCELGPDEKPCERTAHWVLHRWPCCSAYGNHRLACDKCKDARLSNNIGVECGRCGQVWFDAATAYHLIEELW